MYHVLNRHGLCFSIHAGNHKQAVSLVCRMLGKRTLPSYISVVRTV